MRTSFSANPVIYLLSFVLIAACTCTFPSFVLGQTQSALSIDVKVSKDNASPSTTISTAAFSTTASKELLLAFISSDAANSSPNTTVTGVAGGGLTWELVQRTNVQLGTAEIWRAFALTTLSSAKVTATLSESVDSSLTVVTFIGADPSGLNGLGAIGAVGSGNSTGGAPTGSLVTTRNQSWVFGVGNDWDNSISRTPGTNQSVVHQYLAPVHDTYWVQSQNAVTPQAGTSVTVNDTAPTTDRFNLSLVEVLPAQIPPPRGPLSLDSEVSSDKSTASKTNATPAFSTSSTNELLLAFISADNKASPNTTVTAISGGGLTWQLVERTNAQLGTAEVWRAFAASQLSNVAVTVTLSQSVASSVTVLSFLGADGSGTNGSGAIGATGTGNGSSGAPTASLHTTRNDSWVFGVGNDWTNAISRTPGSNQALVHQYLATVNDTYWVQALRLPTSASGTNVTINDTAPTSDLYNLSIVEILPATTSSPLQISASASPAANANGWNRTNVTVTFQCSGGVSPVHCPSPVTVTTEGAAQQIGGTATDAEGNTASTSVQVSIDKTAPSIVASAAPPPNANGWNNTPVTITFLCADTLSGVASCPAQQIVSTPGVNQVITGTVTDIAGNTAATSVTLNISTVPPTITASLSSSPNSAGWYNKPVTITYHCAGATGVPVTCPPPATVNTDGFGKVITGTATDAAGNTASVTNSINLDQTPPVLNVTLPANNASFNLSPVGVQGLATDSLSGLNAVSCAGSVAVVSPSGFTCNVTLNPGSNQVPITATDIAGNATVSNLTLAMVTPISVQITSPTVLQLFSSNPITVTGSVAASGSTVTVGGVTAIVSNGTFTASGVMLREGTNLLTASATTPNFGVGQASVSVVLDTTPPTITITNPSPGVAVTSAQIDVTGNVNDLVSGTVNAGQVSVTVNGVTAVVANRSFVAHNILLVPGTNTITAVATDRAGNTSQARSQVTLQPLTGRQALSIVSGNAQSAPISTLLPQPLTVVATDGLGRPMPNLALNFAVVRGDGILLASPQQGRSLTVKTGANGQAGVQLQLGTRYGVGINQVAVSAPGFVGQTMFSADSTLGAATSLRVVSGEVQSGAVGLAIAEPLVVIAIDAGGNPVPNVPVTFAVQSGGGLIGGQAALTQNTDSDGKSYAVLVLGQQPGINNNSVSASFNGMTGSPAVFSASALVPGPATSTAVTGLVLDNADQPIPNATASIRGTNLSARTDAQGNFSIANAPVGDLVLFVDGSTSTRTETFPTLSFQMATVSGVNNSLGHPIYLPAIDTANSQVVGGNQPVQLTMTGVPGVIYTVAPNSVTFPDGSHVGRVTLSQVHANRVPMTPANGTSPRLVSTLQPAGVLFNPPIQMQLPNTDGLPAGQVVEIYSFRHDLEQFVVEGTARVSEDGSVIVSDPGYGLSVSGWHDVPPQGGSAPPCNPKKDPCQQAVDDAQQIANDAQGFLNPTTEFADVQACIARLACAGKPGLDNPAWLDAVLPEFVNDLKNQVGPWPEILATCNAISLFDPLRKQECAAMMATNHIFHDLLGAMIENGCGTDNDWNAIKGDITQCLQQEDPILSKLTIPITVFLRNTARGVCQVARQGLGLPTDANP